MAEPEVESPRIASIHVKKLFGLYDHDIPLNEEHRVTILHGPNGVGKTWLLKLTEAALRLDLAGLIEVPYDSLAIRFTSKIVLTVRHFLEHGKLRQTKIGLHKDTEAEGRAWIIEDRGGNWRSGHPQPITGFYAIEKYAEIEDQLAEATHTAALTAHIESLKERLILLKRTERQYEVAPGYEKGISTSHRHTWVSDQAILEALEGTATYQIAVTRLTLASPQRAESIIEVSKKAATVAALPQHMKQEFTAVLQRYGEISQRLDQTYTQRLIRNHITSMTSEDLQRKLSALNARQARLIEHDLLPTDNVEPIQAREITEPSDAKALTLYVQDSEMKLQPLEDFAGRIERFTDMLQKRFLNKEIEIYRGSGIVVKANGPGSSFPLSALSSGEQHQLVLLYDLLFRVPRGTLVLIDEPELSMHITWQEHFIPDLLDIAKSRGLYAIVATHSPYILGDRPDLEVALSGAVST